MMRYVKAAFAASLIAAPAFAADWSEGSQAREWGLLGEEKARFEATVVDLLCEVAGDCPANCGAGTRQMGLKRTADGVLVLPMKNRQPVFSGAATDLYPYCGKDVEVDGVLVGDEEQTPVKYYLVQLIREKGQKDWVKTSKWTKEWAAQNPELKGVKGPWFRKDPRVKAAIEADGYLGLGAEADAAFIKYYFEE